MTRCGFIALCGKPNVGKSTLFNRLLDARLAAVTGKPQTTRHNIKGILTEDAVQYVFVDTPGIHAGHSRRLSQLLNVNARDALMRVDVVVLMVECGVWNHRDQEVQERLAEMQQPVLLCANKMDRLADRVELLPFFEQLSAFGFSEYIPISARTGDGVDALKQTLTAYLPKREHLFESDDLTDRQQRFFVEELIREQLLLQLHKELPYATHVQVLKYIDEEKRLYIEVQILVERVTQRAILIGRGGSRLREIGRAARINLEGQLGRTLFLKLQVKVQSNWQQDARIQSSYQGGV